MPSKRSVTKRAPTAPTTAVFPGLSPSTALSWQAWGPEAFAQALREEKPVLLVIGYATSHECHQLAHQVLTQREVAFVLQEHFVLVFMDRDQHPLQDEYYRTAALLMSGRTGWPVCLCLSPTQHPWFALAAPSAAEDWKSLLLRLELTWKTRRAEVEHQAEQVSQAITAIQASFTAEPRPDPSRDLVEQQLYLLRGLFDERFGGFGRGPKYPPHAALRLLFYEHQRTEDKSLLALASRTLESLSLGGIHDHLGGGFHRATKDEYWLSPYFEKTLYDNVQLAQAFAEGYWHTGVSDYRRIATETYEWILAHLGDGHGTFCSGWSADQEAGKEGEYYFWTEREVVRALGKKEAAFFNEVYHVQSEGNYLDEGTGARTGKNILFLTQSFSELSRNLGLRTDLLRNQLAKDRAKLLSLRNRRTAPLLDTRVFTGWNGLAISSLVHGARFLREPRYLKAAIRCANHLLEHRWAPGQRLVRSGQHRDSTLAILDDYAFLIQGLIDLHDQDKEGGWLARAERMTQDLLQNYHDSQHGGFFLAPLSANEPHSQLKIPYDQATPSGNAASIQVLLRLAEATGRSAYWDAATQALSAFQRVMRSSLRGVENLAVAKALQVDQCSFFGCACTVKPQGVVQHRAVKVEFLAPVHRVLPGQNVPFGFRLTVKPGWHLNSHQSFQKYLQVTEVKVSENPKLNANRIEYPLGQELEIQGRKEPVLVYRDPLELKGFLKVGEGVRNLFWPVRIKLTFQASDGRQTLRPTTLHFKLRLKVRLPDLNVPAYPGIKLKSWKPKT